MSACSFWSFSHFVYLSLCASRNERPQLSLPFEVQKLAIALSSGFDHSVLKGVNMICELSIRNFRSIANADIPANWITTLVGANDAGKSNVLRALNLFFNGQTNPGEAFDFGRDHNQFAIVRQRKAAQIEIGIKFKLPSGYLRDDQPEEVVWRKVWRRDGEVRSLETRSFTDGSPFPPRSKIPALLDRIQFTYVPAIKDKAFFADLQGKLYDVLASVAEQPLKDSAGAFQEQLGEQLRNLLDSLRDVFSADATMRLPENLREIFENLEINSGGIPLSRRGDGIKIRHIPKMLKFIAEKRDELLTSGGVRYTHIWGFEEPENNVEMGAAFKMVDELVQVIADSDLYQLFITTHSPIFYRIDRYRPDAIEWLTSYFVSKLENDTIIETRRPDEVDETMGLMPIVAPYVAEAKKRHDELEAQLGTVREIAEQRKPTIFVEGDSDRVVLMKAWEHFSDVPTALVNICSGEEAYGGASALRSRALAWLLTLRHRPPAQRVKAAAIFDADATGMKEKSALSEEMKRLNLTGLGLRVVALEKPPRLRHLAQQGYNLPVDLEAYYTDALWERAERSGWLEEIEDLSQLLSRKMLATMAAGGANPFAALSPEDALRLKNRFNDRGKRSASRWLSNLEKPEAGQQLDGLRPLIAELRGHLLPAV